MSNKVVIAGVGMVPFKKPGQSDPYDIMGQNATRAALSDAGIGYGLIEQAMNLSEEERAAPPAVAMFAAQVDAMLQAGISEETIASISCKARRHAAHNPNAIFRDPLTVKEILAMPPVFRNLRKLYACPPSCGAAAVIVCNEAFARTHGIRSDVSLIGKGWGSDKKQYFSGSVMDVMFQALSRDAATAAYKDAGIGPEDIDVIELHDCFTTNELATYSALGLCKDEDLNAFVADGDYTYGGRYVINPSGGLLAKGHPLGATGLAQITELTWHLRGDAGKRQVEGARTALQHNGGLGSAGFVHIFQRG